MTTASWFQVQVRKDSPLARDHRLASHFYYWAKRRGEHAYDIFGNSQHGPFVTNIAEAQMQQDCCAIRENGKLHVATPEQTVQLERNLNWYLGK